MNNKPKAMLVSSLAYLGYLYVSFISVWMLGNKAFAVDSSKRFFGEAYGVVLGLSMFSIVAFLIVLGVGRNMQKVYDHQYKSLVDQKSMYSELKEEAVDFEKYMSLVEQTNELIWTTNNNGKITYINNASKNMLGYLPEDLISKDITDILINGTRDSMLKFFKKYNKKYGKKGSFKGDVCLKPKSMMLMFRKNKRSERVIVQSFISKYFVDGKFSGLKGTAIDVTSQIEDIYNARKEREHTMRSLLSSGKEMEDLAKSIEQYTIN